MWQHVKRALGIATEPEKHARAAFERAYPGEPVAWTRVAADEPTRVVVGVFYGQTRPPSYRFFAVAKGGDAVTAIEDDAPYRPKGWR